MTPFRLLPAAVLMCACQPEAEALPDGLAAVAPGSPAFVVSEIVPGQPVTFGWTDLPPGATVAVFATRQGTGSGPCFPAYALCLGLQGPVTLVGTTTAGPTGFATLTRTAPSSMPWGVTYTFQGATSAAGGATSAPYVRVSGDAACPDVYLPVCGADGQDYSNTCYAELEGVPAQAAGTCLP